MSLSREHQELLTKVELLLECGTEGLVILHQGVGFALGASVYFNRKLGRYIVDLFHSELAQFNPKGLLLEEETPDDQVVRHYRTRLNDIINKEGTAGLPPACTKEDLLEYARKFRNTAVLNQNGEWDSSEKSETVFAIRFTFLPGLGSRKLYLCALDSNHKLMLAPQWVSRYSHAYVVDNSIVNMATEQGLDKSLCYLLERIVVLNPDGVSSYMFGEQF